MSDAKKGENHPMYGQNHSDETKKNYVTFPPFGGVGGVWDAAKKIDHSGRFKSGQTLSDETKKNKISDAMTGEKHPMYNKPRPEGAGSPSQAIEVTDIKNNITTSYNSISEAARTLNINNATIVKYFANNQQSPYKGRYTFKKFN